MEKHCEDTDSGERSPPVAAGRERRNLAAPSSQPGKLVQHPGLCDWRAVWALPSGGLGSDPARPSLIITVTSLAACLGAGCHLRGASRNLRGNLAEQNLFFVMFQSRKRRPREGK